MLKFILPTLIIILITAFSINLIDAATSYASSGSSYETIQYHCASGETIDRCNYGSSGCDIAGQKLCKSEQQ
ncbi:MAG TPA: hypothetical protein VK982_15205 [Bacteroidales bacterium]|nr:hypothetical protein [Bacteroidales bacterium]